MVLSLASLLSTVVEVVVLPVLLASTAAKTLVLYVARGFKPLYPKWTLRFDLSRAVARHVFDRYGDVMPFTTLPGPIRRLRDYSDTRAGKAACKQHRTTIEPEIANGLEHLWLRSTDRNNGGGGERFVVLYYHGGGYAAGSPRSMISMCNLLRAAMVQELQASASCEIELDFFLANYRKTPDNKFPVPQQDALLIYEYLVEHHKIPPSRIIVMGDSAGAGLTISTLLGLRDANKSYLMPLAAVSICGYFDLTEEPQNFVPPPHCILSQSSVHGVRKAALTDPDDQAEARKYSAVHADLRGLPPVFVQAASLDYLCKNSLDLIAKAKADGVLDNWEVDIHEGVAHDFTIMSPSTLPYAAVGMQHIAVFVAKQIQASLNKAGPTK